MNGGKDVKIGHDKRPVSVIPSDEQLLYNIANGEILTDEFGNPLITKVDQFFLADASRDRSTALRTPSLSWLTPSCVCYCTSLASKLPRSLCVAPASSSSLQRVLDFSKNPIMACYAYSQRRSTRSWKRPTTFLHG